MEKRKRRKGKERGKVSPELWTHWNTTRLLNFRRERKRKPRKLPSGQFICDFGTKNPNVKRG